MSVSERGRGEGIRERERENIRKDVKYAREILLGREAQEKDQTPLERFRRTRDAAITHLIR